MSININTKNNTNIKAIKVTKVWKKGYIGYVYILPWIIGFLAFKLYPFISSFSYSFTDLSLMNTPQFIGFDNYKYAFKNDPLFYKSLEVTFKYVFMTLPLKLGFALLVAVVLNRKVRGINIFRTVYYLPSILGGSVAIAVLWRLLFMREGAVNNIIGMFGIGPLDWLGSPKIALFSITLLSVWQFGSSMVLFLAGLQQVPNELYEAAAVDGSGKIRNFFMITLPIISPIIFFNLIMQMINAFQEFTGAFIVTNGGPLHATYMYGLLLYEAAFKNLKMGYYSALSWILFAIILVFTLILFKTSAKWTFYEDGGDK